MAPVTLLWVLPLVFVIMVAVRSFDDIASNGLGTLPSSFTLTAFQLPGWTEGSPERSATA